MTRPQRVLAIVAHPDDIEIMMGGTMALLRQAGLETHYHTIADGCVGGSHGSRSKLIATRAAEARAGAAVLGAVWHAPLVHDLEILYQVPLLRRLLAVVREVAPTIVLTHGPDDYMEDHVNAGRLAVTASFARGMRHFPSTPRRPPCEDAVTVYHSLPHPLRDQLGRPITASHFVDISSVQTVRREALACHRSQADWLSASQGTGAIELMDATARKVGQMSRRFRMAEGWRRHLPTGLGEEDGDPLATILSRRVVVRRVHSRSG